MPIKVACTTCGETIERKPSDADGNNFCGRECYHEWRRNEWDADALKKRKETLVCELCGDEFEVHPYRADDARFCSRECADRYKKGKTGPEANRWKGAKETFVCENCGDEFEEYPYRNDCRYCSEACYREASKEIFAGDGNPVWRGGRVDNYGPNWEEQRERALERDGHTCQECGMHADDMDRSPDVHHKKRLGWFKEEYDAPEWYEKGNRLENLITLCVSCHMKETWSVGELSNG